jgi:aryl sulfotransferase
VDAAIEWLNDAGGSASANSRQMRQQVNGWSGHAQSWLNQAEIPVFVVRYEDLLADTSATFRGVLGFLGIEAGDGQVERAVANSSFQELKRQESEQGFREASAAGTPFFREGRAGAWRNVLTPAQVEALESVNAPTMKQLGYL